MKSLTASKSVTKVISQCASDSSGRRVSSSSPLEIYGQLCQLRSTVELLRSDIGCVRESQVRTESLAGVVESIRSDIQSVRKSQEGMGADFRSYNSQGDFHAYLPKPQPAPLSTGGIPSHWAALSLRDVDPIPYHDLAQDLIQDRMKWCENRPVVALGTGAEIQKDAPTDTEIKSVSDGNYAEPPDSITQVPTQVVVQSDLDGEHSVNGNIAASNGGQSHRQSLCAESKKNLYKTMRSDAFTSKSFHEENPMLEQRQRLLEKGSLNCIEKMVVHPVFDIIWGLVTLLDTVLVGIEVQWRAVYHNTPSLIVNLSYAFCAAYLLELSMRIHALKWSFFRLQVWGNWLDLVIAISSLVEIAINVIPQALGAKSVNADALQLLIMLRMSRVVRLFRFSIRLRRMALMIFDSIASLLVTVVLVLLVVYVFALTFTMGATRYLDRISMEQVGEAADVEKYYGSVVKSAYTCLRAFLGGQSWGEMLDPLFLVGSHYVCIYVVYIFFTVIALANVINSIFVDSAIFRSSTQRELIVEKELQTKKMCLQNLKDIFENADTDQNGEMTIDEFNAVINKEETQAYLNSLGITHENSNYIFNELDRDESGSIELGEFLESMQLLLNEKFTALDQQRLFFEVRSIGKKLDLLFNEK